MYTNIQRNELTDITNMWLEINQTEIYVSKGTQYTCNILLNKITFDIMDRNIYKNKVWHWVPLPPFWKHTNI